MIGMGSEIQSTPQMAQTLLTMMTMTMMTMTMMVMMICRMQWPVLRATTVHLDQLLIDLNMQNDDHGDDKHYDVSVTPIQTLHNL